MTGEIEPDSKWALDLSKDSSQKEVKFLMRRADESILAAIFESVEAEIRMAQKSDILSHNFLYVIVCMLKRYKLTGEAQLLLNLKACRNPAMQSTEHQSPHYQLQCATLHWRSIMKLDRHLHQMTPLQFYCYGNNNNYY